MTTSTLPAAAKGVPASEAECIRHLSVEARAAFDHFRSSGDPANLDPVVLAILQDYTPRTSARPLAELPGETQLMRDLGFDSLAIAEVVFFTEDLFGVTISNEEIVPVRTLDDLRQFIRGKVTAHATT